MPRLNPPNRQHRQRHGPCAYQRHQFRAEHWLIISGHAEVTLDDVTINLGPGESIDIPIMAGVTGCTFVANDGIESWPLIGWLCKINNTIFVNRENRASVSSQVDDLRAAITGDQPVTIFPEGTTHDGSGLLPFKPSLFAALVPPPAGMLVQPVYLSYGRHTPRLAWVGEEKVTENFWRLLSHLKPITATLHFLEPFDPLHYPDRKAISAEVRARIGAAMEGGGHAARIL